MTELLQWLGTLPAWLLYSAITVAAFAENIFPPLPADTVVALGAFVAARGEGSALGAWAATMVGNLGGAFLMFVLGRRLGAEWLERTLPRLAGAGAADRVRRGYDRFGIWALAASRFLPGVRAVVPPLAGALKVGLWPAVAAMSVASGIWYGMVTWLAFSLGAQADVLLERIGSSQRVAAGVVLGLMAIAVVVWQVQRRRR